MQKFLDDYRKSLLEEARALLKDMVEDEEDQEEIEMVEDHIEELLEATTFEAIVSTYEDFTGLEADDILEDLIRIMDEHLTAD